MFVCSHTVIGAIKTATFGIQEKSPVSVAIKPATFDTYIHTGKKSS
jgi:hypothetical protein